MKCIISIDEKFPIYTIEQPRANSRENDIVTIYGDFYQEFLEVEKKYNEMQKILGKMYEKPEEPHYTHTPNKRKYVQQRFDFATS